MNPDLSRVPKDLFSNPLRAFVAKERWNSGFHDPETNSWLEFSFDRSPRADGFRLSFLQPSARRTQYVRWDGRFGRPEVDDQLRLEAVRPGFCARHQRHDEGLSRFELSTQGWEIDLEIRSTRIPFRTGDRQFEASYDLHQRSGLLATGTISSPEGNLDLVHAPGYSEHSWGVLPRRTRNHRVVLQNDRFCLHASVDAGPFANRCVGALHLDGDEHRWMLLDPQVRFRNSPGYEWDTPWRLESSEMELNMEILQVATHREGVPPFAPVLERSSKSTALVRAVGSVRIDGIWHKTGEMHGILEEHSSRW
ncbi:MAG: hypothetical protein IPO40_23370 [Fibrobacteres bacterium]|nr:hypothetical protein [Fibrobacterota bacterium]